MAENFERNPKYSDDREQRENEWGEWEYGNNREVERIAQNCGYDNVLEMQPSFFDSPEEKAKKKKILENLSEQEKSHFDAGVEAFHENEHTHPLVTFTEVLECVPSIFDGYEEYKRKQKNALQFYPEWFPELPSADKIKFPNAISVRTNEERIRPNVLNSVVVSQDDVFNMGEFFYENGKLKYRNPENDSLVVIGNIWIELKKEIIKKSQRCDEKNAVIGYETEIRWEFLIYCMKNKYLGESDVNGLLDEKKLRKLTHDRVCLEDGAEVKRLYKKYINRLIEEKNFVQQVVYDCTGWIKIDGEWNYLTDKGIVGKPENPIYADVPWQFEFNAQLVGTPGIFTDFWNMRNLCLKHRENSVFLTYYAIAASMTTLYQETGHELNFVVAIVGPTNSQKTSVATVMSRMFDRTKNARPDIRFNSSEIAIVEKMSSYGDAILFVDDFLPYSKNKLMEVQMKKSESIIRSYGDRVPYQRSKIYAKINGVDAYSPIKGCCLMTGEIFKTESESSDTRLVQLQFEKGDVNLGSLSYYQRNLLNYTTFFYDFLSFVGKNIKGIERIIEESVQVTRQNEHERITTARFVDTLALMYSAVKIFYEYTKVRGFLSDVEAERYAEEDCALIKTVIAKNNSESKVKSPATLICYALYLADKNRKIEIFEMTSIGEVENFDNVILEDDRFLYILPDTLWKIYCRYCKETGEDVMYRNGREINEILRKEDLILIKEEGKEKKRRATHKISGVTAKRFFIIKKERLKKILENYLKF